MINYFVYVLENSVDRSWYVGFTSDIDKRLDNHNTHTGGQYTKNKSGHWKLIYYEGYVNKVDAINREKFLKSGSGKMFIRKQIRLYLADLPHGRTLTT